MSRTTYSLLLLPPFLFTILAGVVYVVRPRPRDLQQQASCTHRLLIRRCGGCIYAFPSSPRCGSAYFSPSIPHIHHLAAAGIVLFLSFIYSSNTNFFERVHRRRWLWLAFKSSNSSSWATQASGPYFFPPYTADDGHS